MKRIVFLLGLSMSLPALADQVYTTPFDGKLIFRKQVSETGNPWAVQGAGGFSPLTGNIGWQFSQGKNYNPLEPQSFDPNSGSWVIANANTRLAFLRSFQGKQNVYEIAFGNNGCREPEPDSEVDLFLDPVGTPMNNGNLSEVGELRLDVGYIATQSIKQSGCSVNRSTAVASLYINDVATHKTLALQIALGGTDDKSNSYFPFVWGGNPGIDDYISNFGGNYVKGVGQATNTVDLLPRIVSLIQSGAAGGSTDPRNWYLAGFNAGLINFGKVNVSTNWHGLQFAAKGGAFCSGATRTQFICSPPASSSGWGAPSNGCYHRATSIPC